MQRSSFFYGEKHHARSRVCYSLVSTAQINQKVNENRLISPVSTQLKSMNIETYSRSQETKLLHFAYTCHVYTHALPSMPTFPLVVINSWRSGCVPDWLVPLHTPCEGVAIGRHRGCGLTHTGQLWWSKLWA